MYMVIGCHRSGTSLVAGILHKLGVHMGDNLLGAFKSNPRGHFEDIPIIHINDDILAANETKWHKTLPVTQCPEKIYSRLMAYIEKRKGRGYPWGIKDPRLVITHDIWTKALKESGCEIKRILVWRNPLYIAKSFKMRDGMSRDMAINIATWNQNLMRKMKGLDLAYEDIIKNPVAGIEKIVQYANLKPSQESLQKALDFVDPALDRASM